ncbi:MAG TPA: hypothetical protein VIX59_09060 [Candidatus Binataceae bacterium]
MQQRQGLGCEIALVDPQLPYDGSQFSVVRFESMVATAPGPGGVVGATMVSWTYIEESRLASETAPAEGYASI